MLYIRLTLGQVQNLSIFYGESPNYLNYLSIILDLCIV
ncbi:hypothetical protein J2S09_004733 [Bacillus fengqiuensis]|nr:hypothetical protein [Bacillus fengqiuensis]